MRFSSIRARVAIVSTAFALALVGSVAVGTYVLVANGMRSAAVETADRLAGAAERALVNAVRSAEASATHDGLTGTEADEAVAALITGTPPTPFAEGLAYEGSFALHVVDAPGDAPRRAWDVGDQAETDATMRAAALRTGKTQRYVPGAQSLFTGLLIKAELGWHTTHVPVRIPGISAAVLDVSYAPHAQEAILDATRAPMLVLAAVALVGSLLIAAGATRWAMSLIENLKHTADSVDVGMLDIRLPEEGDNEVSDLARSLNRLIDSLQRRNEVQARFIADASHELATPVAGIRGYVNILRAWGAEDLALREEAVGAIDRESRRMARLCSDLLSLIRSEEQVEYRQTRYDINAVCREVLANAATRYLEKAHEYTGPGEGVLWLHGDADRIEEALGILVDNACKYTPDGGRVSVTTRRSRDRIIIEVADTGVGIPEADLPNVFERFYRSDLSRSQETGGFGLGLAIAKHIIDVSGGTIKVRSAVGRGTTFEVVLPRQRGR
ncbi:MAG: HAMP domain-containing histidine kinase [Coriobacteriia bacterium]|nr:HAMP domain-containing histidine kinase [Coriobacteriia bacterium]MBN2839798.1 HAMP domain-containing histidine kinase [Coriobacteriia bacterium]